jgi:hypothetical protein
MDLRHVVARMAALNAGQGFRDMPHEETACDSDETRLRIRQVVMGALCETLARSRLPPMTVMGFLAEAVGSAYRELADAHDDEDACTCGWRPTPADDVEALQAAMAARAGCRCHRGLLHVPAAGRA